MFQPVTIQTTRQKIDAQHVALNHHFDTKNTNVTFGKVLSELIASRGMLRYNLQQDIESRVLAIEFADGGQLQANKSGTGGNIILNSKPLVSFITNFSGIKGNGRTMLKCATIDNKTSLRFEIRYQFTPVTLF